MVAEDNQEILERILELTDTACEASLEMLERYTSGDLAGTLPLLEDLKAVVRAVCAANELLAPQLEHAYTGEMLENIEDTLDDIQHSVQANRTERAAMKMEFQLFPFLRQLREAFYFWGLIYPDDAEMERYYREEFAEHNQNLYANESGQTPYKLSIVVTAFNHLETTRRCIEQLLRETDFDALNAELILIDHGSTDGTLEFFESLGVGKVIHFKKNVRMYMFATLFQLCKGEYFAFVSNDILVTRNWAGILLNCIESDSQIAAAVPTTPNIANLQMLDVPTNDPDEFIAWANQQNQSDPSRWNDRVRLMPPLGMYRTLAVNRLGFADPYFHSMEFWDDDFSLRARRAGYRQIVCGDVACYHFGSVTGKEGQVKEGTLVYGRELFERKHGVDAWGNGFCYDYHAMQLFSQVLPAQETAYLLAIDCGMGDTPMQLRNELRRRGQGCEVTPLTCQKEYLPDLRPQFRKTQWAADLADGLNSLPAGQSFTCAFLGRDIGVYENFPQLLKAVSSKLCPGGWLVFSCENPFYSLTLHALLQFQFLNGKKRQVLTAPAHVREESKKYFSQVQMISVEHPVNGLKEFAVRHFGTGKRLDEAVQQLRIQKFYFLCRK